MRKGDRVSFSGIFLSSFLVTKQWNLLKAWPDIGDRGPLLSRPRLHTAAPLTAPLGQPTVDDSGHQDVPCHLVALDGGSLGREYSGAHFFTLHDHFPGGFPQCHSGLSNKGISTNQGNRQRRKWQPTPVFLPGEFCGQRSLQAGYSP